MHTRLASTRQKREVGEKKKRKIAARGRLDIKAIGKNPLVIKNVITSEKKKAESVTLSRRESSFHGILILISGRRVFRPRIVSVDVTNRETL